LTYLDAYALVALMGEEPAAARVDSLIHKGDCRVSVVNLAEAIDTAQRVHSLAVDEVRGVLDPIFIEDLLLVQPQRDHAWAVADIRSRYYHRSKCPLSLADCFLIAHALIDERAIATADPPLAEAARGEGIVVTPLPDRSGREP
jgi:PIN domain nuclease of toxin-antitoxin system